MGKLPFERSAALNSFKKMLSREVSPLNEDSLLEDPKDDRRRISFTLNMILKNR